MADEQQPLELFRFAEFGQSVSLRVLPDGPLSRTSSPHHDARLIVESTFVNGELHMCVSELEVNEWERCLDALERDERTEWPENWRSQWIEVVPEDPVEVIVHDMPASRVVVRVPIEVDDDWLEANRARLAEVRRYLAGRPPSQPARDLA